MKTTLITLFIAIIACSCKDEKTSFTGLGELVIGANIDSLPSRKAFLEKSKGEFFASNCMISGVIGTVQDVTVKTRNAKIYFVSFAATNPKSRQRIQDYLDTQTKEQSRIMESAGYISFDQKVIVVKFLRDSTATNAPGAIREVTHNYFDAEIYGIVSDSIKKVKYDKKTNRSKFSD